MRKIHLQMAGLTSALVVSFTSLLSSCNVTEDGSYVAPISINEKIHGKWSLQSLDQTDEITMKKMSLTDALQFKTFAITLNATAEGTPSTFTIEGEAPLLLPTSGTWKLDYDYYKSDGSASRLLLNDGQKNHEVIVTAIPGNEKTLAFKLIRKLAGKPFVSYTYNLTSSTKSEEAQP